MIKTIEGDILQAKTKSILHQCNCFHVFGGLATHIGRQWPEAEVADLTTDRGDLNKMGTFSMGVISKPKTPVKCIFNVYGQFEPGPNTEQDMLLTGILRVSEFMMSTLKDQIPIDSVAIPYKIGCGIGGGNWEEIEFGLEKIFKDLPIEAIIYRRPGD